MNTAERTLTAITYEGNRFRKAWLMASGCYHYTRSHDGDVISDAGDTISFSRWYCFKEAAKLGWEYLCRTDRGGQS